MYTCMCTSRPLRACAHAWVRAAWARDVRWQAEVGGVRMRGPTSMMSALVRLSCGSLYSVYLSSTLSMSVLAYWNSLLEWLKMMSAISQSHNTLNSYAFFMSPNFRLVNVTCRWADGQPDLAQSRPAQESPPTGSWTQPLLGSPHLRVTQLSSQEPLVWGRNRPAPLCQHMATT